MKNKIIPALFALPLLATSASAAITLSGDGVIGPIVTLTGDQLRQQDLTITDAGDEFTYDSSSAVIGGDGGGAFVTTIDISAGSFIGAGRGYFLGNGNGDGNIFNLSGGSVLFEQGLGIARDDSTALVTISGGSFTVDGALTFDIASGGGVDTADGSIDFTTGSTGTLTVAGLTETDYEALYTAGDLTFAGDNSATFADVFEVSGNTLSLVVPEPSSTALLGLGGLALILRRRK